MSNIINKIVALSCLFLTLSKAEDSVMSGCSAKVSEDTFNGLFNVDDIKAIRIVKSDQKSVYPVPELKKINESDSFKDREFFVDFKKSISSPEDKKSDLIKKEDSSFHIIVEFKKGNNACLHGRITNFGFILEPMFNGNSFSGRNNEIYNVIMLRRKKQLE